MQSEIEATFLDADHKELRKKLKELGAICETPNFTMIRTAYDYPDLRLDTKKAWVRVRKESDCITMAFKQRLSEDVDGMKEAEIEISSYEDACVILESIGLVKKAVQETKREVWRLADCEVMLDEWPWIPPYVEIEGPSEPSVRAVSERLGFDVGDAMFDSTDAVYQKYFDVSRTEISTVPITFGPVPSWLEKKRRT